jgi:3-dehydroquinate synthase
VEVSVTRAGSKTESAEIEISGTVAVDGPHPYEVVVGKGVLRSVAGLVPQMARRVAILYAPAMLKQAQSIAADIEASGRFVLSIELPEAEAAKTIETAAVCWAKLGESNFNRTDVVIAVGGGATTDLAGFVAACWLRGVPIIQVPTTLLGMVDAAVGGKTGINTKAGKNLVGAIHPPAAVVCDIDLLGGLPAPDYAAGLAEVVKAGFIADPTILEVVESDPERVLDPTSEIVVELVLRAIRVKAAVVADDLAESVDRELGREVLNYGHTLAHAIERAEAYAWRHGDAVSVGMMFAAALSVASGQLDQQDLERHRQVLTLLGLPTTYRGAGADELLAAMYLDKKTRGDMLRFIILERVGRPALLAAPNDEWLAKAFAEVR